MAIVLSTTTLSAELATWKPYALEVIVRPEYWSLHGASRMGKALSAQDRYGEAGRLPASALAAGAKAAREVIRFLAQTEPALADLREPDPIEARDEVEAGAALAALQTDFGALEPRGVELVLTLAHRLQAGETVSLETLGHEAPSKPERPDGPMSALLAMGLETIWLPRPMRFAWDGPFGCVASLPQLRADVLALPAALREPATPPAEAEPAWRVVRRLMDVIEAAGERRCVRAQG